MEKKVPVRVIISKLDKSIRIRAMLSGIIRKGEELIVDDEVTGEAFPVHVTSIEVGDKRKYSAKAEEIKTLWARSIEEVVVKIAVSRGETTESIELKVPGEREFVVGEDIEINKRRLKISKIKIREGGFKSRKGVEVKAKDIKRIYADSGVSEHKISKTERVVVKKRVSSWSLRSRRTG